MIKTYSLLALQKAMNGALSLDEDMPIKMKPLEGKVLEIVVNPLNICFFIQFQQSQIRLLSYFEGIPDTIIHSNPLGLIRLSLLPASKLRSLFNDNIRISGNVELGQQVKALFDNIEIDWEGHLAHFTGDVVAHQIGSWVRETYAFNRRLVSSFKRSFTEYLQEERRIFPTMQEVNDFFQDIDDLNLRLERLIAHFNQLSVEHERH
ncbi:MAG TPA: SCP2 sterol-binding domain-containing protein [Legionellaceae bacterium]|nr:SCP2 sterol-binding domain-containing protein [Legionellaceae bacterium]